MAPRSLRQALAGLGSAVAATLAAHTLRELPWGLAAIVGLAVGVLVVASLQSGERVRAAWRRDDRDAGES